MTSGTPADTVIHPALEDRAGVSLPENRLSDRRRLAVLLQGAALLGHLRRAGWCLVDGWNGARIDGDGLLCALAAQPGADAALPQERVRDLLAELFGLEPDGPLAGRGEARKAGRSLLERWRQSLTPEAPERLVADLFEQASFLWRREAAAARGALAAELRWGDRHRLRIAGPRAFERRVWARAEDLGSAGEVLAAPGARDLWAPAEGDPLELAAAGRCSAAMERWRSASGGEDAVDLARLLLARGRFEDALEVLGRRRTAQALVLRGVCQLYLGKPRAARRLLTQLEKVRRSAEETLDAAALGVRVGSNLGDRDCVEDWIQRALEAGEADGGRILQRAHLEAAMAAWDGGDDEVMARHLEASRELQDDPRWAWRWHQGQALAAQARGDGETMVAHLTQALGPHRRRLTRFEAGSLWNDLGVGRAQLGDLAGSERAFLRAQRLLGSCQGPRRTTLTLYNLAEIRLRRGRLKGVREILEASTAENRLAGNLRGAVQDAELWARYEMVQGRFTAAAAHLRSTLEELQSKDSTWRREAVEMLLARALGLAGAAEAAAEVLEQSTPPLDELEPEERPALWAQAGLRERALEQAGEAGAGSRLWRDVLTGAPPAADRWYEVEELGDFRAARLVLDLELVSSGVVPVRLRRRAAGTLRRLGAAPSAARLEAVDAGPWEALAAYQQQALTADSEAREIAPEMAQLLTAAGYPEAQLEWRRDGAVGEPPWVIKPTKAAEPLPAPLPEVAEAELPGGRLVLQAAALDPTLAALFTVLVRDFEPPRRRRSSRHGSMVGESPALGRALERLERLAGSPVPVLIQGESGTGKELAARRVHELSPRKDGPFVALNCAALSENLVLSDLFGHVRGAFTGADRDRAGVFETARGGTVFLDEIGDLPLSAQGNLLRVLQEGEVRRLGESLPRKVDVRVVAATHHDLEQRVAGGDFRRDLFYRLRVALVTLPPLRDRGQDVLLLAEHFLHGAHGGGDLTAAARARLLGHSWPGNVRELRNVLSVGVALAEGGVVDEGHLDLPSEASAPVTDYHQSLEAFRRRLVTEALEAADGNRAEAARRLGMSRQALSYLVRQLRLDQ